MWLLHSELCAATINPTDPSTRDSSSIAIAYSMYPRSAPPYSSGKITPKSPISASFGMISTGKCEASSHSITCGAISPSANSRTLRRNCCCSSVNEKSTGILGRSKFYLYPAKVWLIPIVPQKLPADRVVLGLVLLVEPKFQGREVIRQRARIHFLLTSQGFERFLPRLALPQREHIVQPLAGSFVVVNRAAMQRAVYPRLPAQRPLKLKPQNARQKITH